MNEETCHFCRRYSLRGAFCSKVCLGLHQRTPLAVRRQLTTQARQRLVHDFYEAVARMAREEDATRPSGVAAWLGAVVFAVLILLVSLGVVW